VADVQLENGHFHIANELVEALVRTPLNGSQSRIVWAVIRETYGWNRKLARLSMRRIAAMTGIDRRNVRREVSTLVNAGVIVRRGQNGEGPQLGIAKDYESWKLDRGRGASSPPGVNSPQGVNWQPKKEGEFTPLKEKTVLKTKARAKKPRAADRRYQPLVDHYLKRTEELTGTKPFDAADGKNLRDLLARNPETLLTEITRWLDNAFDSTKTYPLQPGFRMTEFCRQYAKYTRGPLLADQRRGQGGMTQEELHAAAKLEIQKAQEAYATP